MAQNKWVSTKSDPKLLYLSALILTIIACASAAWEKDHPSPASNLIKWRKEVDAITESKKTGRPLLYVFSADWCAPCKKMESEAFGRQQIWHTINDRYVPVLVMDEAQEKGKNPPAIANLQARCDVRGFPTLMVVPPCLIASETKDLFSTGNIVEHKLIAASLGWPFNSDGFFGSAPGLSADYADDMLDMDHQRIPSHVGYESPKDIETFLFRCTLWHHLPPSKGKIFWQPVSAAAVSSKRPKLIVFVEDCGYLSDKMRIRLFENKEASAFINEDFTPILVEFSRDDRIKNTSEERLLKDKFQIKSLPALVVLTSGAKPVIQDGFSDSEHTMQFLNRALHSNN